MKVIYTKVHGYLDYVLGFILLLVPSLLQLDSNSLESLIFYILSILTLFYSILTDYELGVYKVLPMRMHLIADLLAGVFLLTSPWIFGFYHTIYLPHVILGLIEIGIAILTKSEVQYA
ncbi:SPW repeat domain-containing protein [Flavobacterium sp.]|uniref:SPW repeat domain-containing protein n=1 Tax=Flavobacterium sp. TaxID=239 RepID=UPI002CCB971B|nr:SPW repeat protein [Flavobacterium sp.]HSD06236.1 SPW repeat protein [Flavobacterium sp.]